MSPVRTSNYLADLVRELRALPHETEWVEFKVNNTKPELIGEYVSALANSAALCGRSSAYVVWGVDDSTHDLVGTSFVPAEEKVGNEQLENWLLHSLDPQPGLRFHEVEVDGTIVVLLEIERASHRPVAFRGQEYIRVGSYKKKLKDVPEKERQLWRCFDTTPFEGRVATLRSEPADVLALLDYPAYFDLLERPLPTDRAAILDDLEGESLIRRNDAGRWEITNLGAILFAKPLDAFRDLKRKAVRVILYKGASRVETVREHVDTKGYASGFEGLIGYVNSLLPRNEVLGQALRRDVPLYPEIAVREIVANALIHQDFSITGAGPMVEIFDDRMEVTSPGEPLVPTDRFVDAPPHSRNEALASLMRRMGICEERGSGIDKVVFQTELYQLPAPLFEVTGDSTRIVLFAPRPLGEMDKEDRIRACYLHACLQYVSRGFLTNTSLRKRFGIEDKNAATASRLIKEAIEAGRIVAHDPEAAKRDMKYVPWWAQKGER